MNKKHPVIVPRPFALSLCLRVLVISPFSCAPVGASCWDAQGVEATGYFGPDAPIAVAVHVGLLEQDGSLQTSCLPVLRDERFATEIRAKSQK
jgi:hypothetical protein